MPARVGRRELEPAWSASLNQEVRGESTASLRLQPGATSMLKINERPNPRVQRTRPCASLRGSPLTRHPLGGQRT